MAIFSRVLDYENSEERFQPLGFNVHSWVYQARLGSGVYGPPCHDALEICPNPLEW